MTGRRWFELSAIFLLETEYPRQNLLNCAISVITRTEVLAGFDPPQAAIAAQLIEQFPNLKMTSQIADLAAALRHQKSWKLPESWLATDVETK